MVVTLDFHVSRIKKYLSYYIPTYMYNQLHKIYNITHCFPFAPDISVPNVLVLQNSINLTLTAIKQSLANHSFLSRIVFNCFVSYYGYLMLNFEALCKIIEKSCTEATLALVSSLAEVNTVNSFKINMVLHKMVNFIYSYRRGVEEHLPLKAFDNHVELKVGRMVHHFV